MEKMKLGYKLLISVVFILAAIQLIKPDTANPKTEPAIEIVMEPHTKQILERSCFDCHSNKTNWPWYSKIAPVSWIIAEHVEDGRKWVNFSEWESYDENKKLKLKKLMYREVAKAMPLGIYKLAHKNAALSPDEIKEIRDWTGIKANEVSMRD